MKIQNRRYTGSKYKLMSWIKTLILENCPQHNSVFDVFGGTGVVTAELLDISQANVINDFLFSNEIIYKAFFSRGRYGVSKIKAFQKKYEGLDSELLPENYVSENYGDKYFEKKAAKKIGFIREDIEVNRRQGNINEREFCILLASLLYSMDRCANTVGHYEAYLRGKVNRTDFEFELVEPIKTQNLIRIYRKDANELARSIHADVAFVDPPYNSRQYSRFYHVLETITKWDKPKLEGTALKPPEENMSEYCRNSAPAAFEDLISHLSVRYIVVTYNNTYDSKSSSSKNKITLEQISEILGKKGETKVFEKKYHRFNAGKTDATNHKEFVFITKVEE
jgi:adenine-specific DNA-methyltransferase